MGDDDGDDDPLTALLLTTSGTIDEITFDKNYVANALLDE